MIGDEAIELSMAYQRVRGVSRVARAICLVLLICVPLITFALCLAVFISAGSFSLSVGMAACHFMIFCAICESLILLFYKAFCDIVNGLSPFTMSQVRRLRIAALLLLVFTLFEAVSSVLIDSVFVLNGVSLGLTHSGVGEHVVSVNFGAVFLSILLACFSVMFKYGLILQKFSDETL